MEAAVEVAALACKVRQSQISISIIWLFGYDLLVDIANHIKLVFPFMQVRLVEQDCQA